VVGDLAVEGLTAAAQVGEARPDLRFRWNHASGLRNIPFPET
jgi:hypothetical protein